MARQTDRPPTSHVKLLREDRTDLGLLTTNEPNWTAGHQIHHADGSLLEVVRTVAAEQDDNVHATQSRKTDTECGDLNGT